jgi:methionyl-tRNA formyltransferase
MKSNFKNTKSVTLAAHGHGGVAALISLQNVFEKVFVLTDDCNIKKSLRNCDILIDSFSQGDSDTVVCAGYHKIITKEELKNWNFINTHPSLLPKYRGLHSLAWAMLNLEKTVGFSIHLINENIDDGPILEQFSVDVGNKNSNEIMFLFDDYVAKNLGRVVRAYMSGDLTPVKQDESLATWCCRRNIKDCLIDFSMTHDQLKAFFKVLVEPYPLPMVSIKSRLLEIVEADVRHEDSLMTIGRIVNMNKFAFIKAKESIIIVKKLRDFETGEYLNIKDTFKLGMRL